MLNDNGDEIISPTPLDECLRRRKMIYQNSCDNCEEIGCDCSCPALTLCSECEYTIRLSYERQELCLHIDLDFRLLGRQGKGEDRKVRDSSIIGILDFNYNYGFGCFSLFVMSFSGVVISLHYIAGMKFKLVTFILRCVVLVGTLQLYS